jgi:hypothetical protein
VTRCVVSPCCLHLVLLLGPARLVQLTVNEQVFNKRIMSFAQNLPYQWDHSDMCISWGPGAEMRAKFNGSPLALVATILNLSKAVICGEPVKTWRRGVKQPGPAMMPAGLATTGETGLLSPASSRVIHAGGSNLFGSK